MAKLNPGTPMAIGGGDLQSHPCAFPDNSNQTEGKTGRIIKGVSWDVWGTLLCRTADGKAVEASRAQLIAQAAGIDIVTALECLGFGHPDEEASAGAACIGLAVAERLGLALSRRKESSLDFQALAESLSDLPIGKEVEAIDFASEVIDSLTRFPHVIVSNTEWTSGSTLRGLLAAKFPGAVFQNMAFSDEAGWAKPSPRIFESAWRGAGIDPRETAHIGDRADRDLAGAHAAGAASVISRVFRRTREKGDTTADAILYDYRGLRALLDYLQGTGLACDREPVAQGLPVWGSLVVGRVRKVDRPDEESFSTFQEGSILVVNNSSPDFVPYFRRAGAVLAEVGGYGSHAAQTAPLCDVPCIVGLDSLYDRVEDNDLILVDAFQGLVIGLDCDD